MTSQFRWPQCNGLPLLIAANDGTGASALIEGKCSQYAHCPFRLGQGQARFGMTGKFTRFAAAQQVDYKRDRSIPSRRDIDTDRRDGRTPQSLVITDPDSVASTMSSKNGATSPGRSAASAANTSIPPQTEPVIVTPQEFGKAGCVAVKQLRTAFSRFVQHLEGIAADGAIGMIEPGDEIGNASDGSFCAAMTSANARLGASSCRPSELAN
ncbi:MAG: hypothetical protein R2839_08455 [Thermomicrobiales bacterium]